MLYSNLPYKNGSELLGQTVPVLAITGGTISKRHCDQPSVQKSFVFCKDNFCQGPYIIDGNLEHVAHA